MNASIAQHCVQAQGGNMYQSRPQLGHMAQGCLIFFAQCGSMWVTNDQGVVSLLRAEGPRLSCYFGAF